MRRYEDVRSEFHQFEPSPVPIPNEFQRWRLIREDAATAHLNFPILIHCVHEIYYESVIWGVRHPELKRCRALRLDLIDSTTHSVVFFHAAVLLQSLLAINILPIAGGAERYKTRGNAVQGTSI